MVEDLKEVTCLTIAPDRIALVATMIILVLATIYLHKVKKFYVFSEEEHHVHHHPRSLCPMSLIAGKQGRDNSS